YVHEGMHVTANRAYLELFGLAGEDEIEGLPMLHMIASSEHKTFKKLLRKLSADAEYSTEVKTTCLRNTGSEFNAELHFTPASIDGEPCTQVIIRDQSISREVEEKLRLLSTQDVQTGLYTTANIFLDNWMKRPSTTLARVITRKPFFTSPWITSQRYVAKQVSKQVMHLRVNYEKSYPNRRYLHVLETILLPFCHPRRR
ncbi:MAG: PAS domain-containing protein, partial [Candidatus Thiodiazotropha sp. (ex Ustalcina ferruginea)]|nr:PAS domain-containing protein [Candidatus Thiodiazotropha sp. (ex Ustalcina ferruginea)]